MRNVMIGAILWSACTSSKYTITEQSVCDGALQSEEDGVDSPYDKDGDGYFDGSNPDCESTYDLETLDCDDNNPDVFPGADEVECDGMDNDCDETTLDEQDLDEDGYFSCDDCVDNDPEINPSITEITCDGIDNDCDETTLDSFDADNDGFSSCEDCVDNDPEVSPGATEIECNGVDDDCNDETLDGEDLDGDGVSVCEDCDDSNELNAPGREEICDGMDNDCDDLVDEIEECAASDYSDTWIITPAVNYACAANIVTLNLNAVEIVDANPVILVSGLSGLQPGSMSGTFTSATDFEATNFISSGGGGCDETYSITGTFTSQNTFEATFTAEYFDASGTGFGCGDTAIFTPPCTDQSVTITGTR